MIQKKQILGVVICALTLLSSGAYYTYSKDINILQDTSNNKINNSKIKTEHNFMETPFTQDQLIYQSDIVIIGEITEHLTEYNFIDYDRNEYDAEDAMLLCSLYNINIDEILLGEENLVDDNKKNIRLTLGGNTLPENLEFDKKYTMCLMKMESMEDDVYCVSVNQGIFHHREDNMMNNAGKVFNVNNFEEKVNVIEMQKKEDVFLETDILETGTYIKDK